MSAIPSSEPPRRILVVCLRYLGDTLLLRPALRALRSKFPEAQIDALVTAGTACALEGCEDVGHVREWPRKPLLGPLRAAWEIRRAGYDWFIDYTGNDRTGLIALFSAARWRITYERKKFPTWSLRRAPYNFRVRQKKDKPHIVIQRLELLEACGVPSCGPEIRLEAGAGAREWARREIGPGPVLVAHLTSRDMMKAIPVETAREVFRAFRAKGGSVVVTSGPAEAERQHAAAAAGEGIRVFSDLDFRRLVALIEAGDLFWGADTAPSHIAWALGKRMLVEFGPSRASHWYPLGAQAEYVEHACACREAGKMTCPAGTPAACLRAAGARTALAWLEG